MTSRHCKALAFLLVAAGFLAPESATGQDAKQDRFGDPVPAGALARLGTVRWRHGAAVTSVLYTPDGRTLITDSQDGTARVWDLRNGVELRRFARSSQPQPSMDEGRPSSRGAGNGAVLSHDGLTLAVGAKDGRITLWEVKTAKVIRTLMPDAPTEPVSMLFTADNKRLLVKDMDQVVWVWDPAAAKVLHKLGKSVEGRRYVSGSLTDAPSVLAGGQDVTSVVMEQKNRQSQITICRWDLTTGEEKKPVALGPGHVTFSSFSFAPDGKTIAAAFNRGILHLRDLETGKEIRTFEGLDKNTFVARLAFSPDGRCLAAWLSDQTIHIWDAATGKELRRLEHPQGSTVASTYSFGGTQPSNLVFSPNGREIAVGLDGGSVRRWEVESGKELTETSGHRSEAHTLVVAPDGKTAISCGSDRIVCVWDLSNGAELRRFALPTDASQVAFAPGGRTLAVGNPEAKVAIWDVATGKERRQWTTKQNNLAGLTFSPDGKLLATRSFDQVISLWDPTTGTLIQSIWESPPDRPLIDIGKLLSSHLSSHVPNLFFTPDGAALTAVSPAKSPAVRPTLARLRPPSPIASTIQLFDVATSKSLRPFDTCASDTLAFACAPDGRTFAVALSDGSVSLWESASGKERLRAAVRKGRTVSALAFSPDSRILVGGDDHAGICLWDTLTGKEIGQRPGHQGMVHVLAFSTDGKRLVSGSADTSLLVWDVTREVQEARVRHATLDDGQEEALWRALASADPARAQTGFVPLIANPARTVPLFRTHLRPVSAPNSAKVAELFVNLDSKEFAVRQRAFEELLKYGELIQPALKQVLEDQPPLDRQRRLKQLQDRLVSGTALPVEELQGLRAIEILERMGTPEAQDVLRSLTGGAAGARLTQHAKASLLRLKKS
ncbi:MAG: WD40 repeat domain-containing protein [Gemmataceae bacterium]|nr:WD40 repeat domain-containing protein [Gemmataceae bacterium]